MLRLFAFALAALCLTPLAVAQEGARTLSVSGEGEVAARPDVAVLTLAVVSEGPSAAEAVQRTSERAAAVLATLKAEGIAERDLQTAGLSVQPRAAYAQGRPPRIEGYLARNAIRATVRQVERAGALLDAAVKSGANAAGDLAFDLSHRGAKEDEARRRAELYAAALGVRLGPLRSVAEGGVVSPLPQMGLRTASEAAPAAPVEPGEVTIRASVSVVFDLQP